MFQKVTAKVALSSVILQLFLPFMGVGAPTTYASIDATYDFNSDTIGSTPANVTPQNGTVRAQSYSGASDTGMEALTASSSNTHVSDMDSISSASNYSVTWKETYTTARRSGFILRANGSNTQNPGAGQGYLFQVNSSNGNMRIYRSNATTYTQLVNFNLSAPGANTPRWYKATASGSNLTLEYSNDGTTFLTGAVATDATYSSGTTQYTMGFGNGQGGLFVDDIEFDDFGTSTPPSGGILAYDFEGDTVGTAPANITVANGTFDTTDHSTEGQSMSPVSSSGGSVVIADLDTIPSLTNSTVTWKETYTTAGRGGMILRANGSNSTALGTKQGYLFQASPSNGSLRIYNSAASSYPILSNVTVSAPGVNTPRWYRATASGTTLTFEYSDDGINYTTAGNITDSTHTGAGTVQFARGYGSSVTGTHIDDIYYESFDAPSSGSVAITNLDEYQVIQRTGTGADIVVSGTYTGNPTSIEASFNGGAFAVVDASPTGGTFSGTLASQNQGQGTLIVRHSNDTSLSGSLDNIGIGDIFIISGQSNASGRGNTNNTYSHGSLKATMFGNDDVWKEMVDPVDGNAGQVDSVSSDGASGSPWPLVATQIMAAEGVPVAFVPTPKGGTRTSQWQPSASTSTLYGSMARRINEVGGTVRANLWFQGESNASNGTTEATYETELGTIVDTISTDFSGLKTIIGQIGHSSFAGNDTIRKAQVDLINANTNALAGPLTYDINLADESGDTLHFKSDSDMAEYANRWYEAIDATIYGGADGYGPILDTANLEYDSGINKITVPFNETLSGSSTVTTDSFDLKNNGSSVAISNVTITGSIIEITPTAALNTTQTMMLSYASLNDAVDEAIYDIVSLPAQPFYDETITLAASTPIDAPGGVSSNLSFWLKANEETAADDVAITTVENFADNSNGDGTGHAPIFQNDTANNINFNPVYRFDGTSGNTSSNHFEFSSILGSSTYTEATVYTVQNVQGATGGGVFGEDIAATNDDARFMVHNPLGATTYWLANPSNWETYNASPVLQGRSALQTFGVSVTSGEDKYIRENGIQVDDGANADISFTGNNSPFYIGCGIANASTNPGWCANSNIAEVVVYLGGSGQDFIERQQVESYLALKYGITLDATIGSYKDSTGSDVYTMANTETFDFTFGPTNNGGGGSGTSGIGGAANTFTLSESSTVTITHSGAITASNAGLGISTSVLPNDANTVAAASPFNTDPSINRIDGTTSVKTYTTTLAAGTYYVGVFSGGGGSADGHDISIRAVGVASYENDIFGIAQDDGAELDQRISQSVNSTDNLILATTQDFISENTATGRTSLGDGNFLIMGDNGVTINSFTNSFDGGTNNASDRIWRVEETGTVGNVYIGVPIAQIANMPSGGAPAIAISDDTTFDNTDTVVSLSYDSTNSMYYAEINPVDGDYISFVVSDIAVSQPAYYRGSSSATGTDGATSYPSYADFIANTNGTFIPFTNEWAFVDSFLVDGSYFYRTNNVIDKITRYPSIEDMGAATNGVEYTLSQTWGTNDEFFTDGTNFYRGGSISTTGTDAITTHPSFTDLVANTNGVQTNLNTNWSFNDQLTHDGQYFLRTNVSATGQDGVTRYASLADFASNIPFDSQDFTSGGNPQEWAFNDDIYALGITATFTINETSLTIAENAGTGSFTIVLDAQPLTDVVFDISSEDTGEATVSPTTLTFTSTDWNAAQTVTVTGVDDGLTATHTGTITISVNDTSSYDAFDSLADKLVALTLTDDDVIVPASPGGVSAGLEFWVKAGTGTNVDGSNFLTTSGGDAWLDQSGNARHIDFIGDTPQLQDNGVNFNPVIDWNGSDFGRHDGQGTFFSGYTEGDRFFVAQSDNTTSNGFPDFLGGGNGDLYADNNSIYDNFGVTTANGRHAWQPNNIAAGPTNNFSDVTDFTVSGTNVDITEYHLYNSTVATNDFRSYLNGGQHGADTSVTIDFAAGGANNLHVGARPSFSLDGRTAEHIFYSQQLTNSERQRVDSYLALKYGITLDQTSATDYVSSAGTGILMWDSSVSSFNNDIAGIGRDSGSDLDQRISKSVNDDALVTITTTNDFTSPNNDAGRTSLDDMSFTSWANNSGGLLFTTTGAPENRKALNRKWQVQETGTGGTLYISVPDNSSTQTTKLGIENTAVYLLVDTDDNFAASGATAREIPLTLSGSNWIGSVDFADGEYFTFATERSIFPGGVAANIQLWFDSSDIDGDGNDVNEPSNGDEIATWINKAGPENATQKSSQSGAIYETDVAEQINGHPLLKFNRVNDTQGSIYEVAGIDFDSITMTGSTVFTVYKPKTNAGVVGQSVWGNDDGGWDRFFYNYWGLGSLGADGVDDGIVGGVTNAILVEDANAIDEVYLLTTKFAGAGNTNASEVYFNGDSVQQFTENSTTSNLDFHIGWDGDGGAFDGQMAELILYDRVLDECEIEEVNNYLGDKYGRDFSGLTSSFTSVSGYDNDVNAIGIASSSCGGNNQVNSMSSAEVFVDNPSSNDTLDEFIIFSHDGGSVASMNTTDIPSGVTARQARSWRVEEETSTGAAADLGTVDIEFDLAQLGLTDTGVDSYVLLIDDDGTFTNASTGSTSYTYTGNNKVKFTGVDFDNGDFFAIAVLDTSSPTVTFNQAATQVDPETGTGVVNFTATFSEPIDVASFTCSDISTSGTATVTCTDITEVSGQNVFNVELTATTDGTILTLILPGVVTDPAGNGNTLSNSTDNSVTVTGVFNNDPTDIALSGSGTIDENSATGSVVGTLSTTDADSGDTHTYSLVSGTGDTDNASFSLSGAQLLTATIFDYETQTGATIRIQTDDGKGGTYAEAFAIGINDLDEISPVISLNGSGTVILEVGDSYTDAGAEYSDNVDGTGSLTASGTVNTSGTGSFTLTYDYTDTAGNPAVQVSRIVNVLDTTSPVITVTGSGTVNHLVGSFYIDANATCSDNLDSSCSVTASGIVDGFTLGTYYIDYDATDASGNAAITQTRTINVITGGIPVITLSGSGTITQEVGDSYTDAGAQYSDIEDGTGAVVGSGTVDINTIASYNITYDYTDSQGNAATQITRTVNIVDTTPPVVPVTTLPTNFNPFTGTGEPGSEVTIYNASGAVIGTGTVTGSGTFSITPSPIPTDGPVTFTTTDPSGNTSTGATIGSGSIDTTPPVVPTVGLPSNFDPLTGTGEPGSEVTIYSSTGVVIGTGTVTGSGTFSITPSPIPTDGPITFTTTDPSGNTSTGAIIGTGSIDTTDPVVPTVDLPSNFDPLTGTGEPGSEVTIYSSTGVIIGTGTVSGSGTFSITPSPIPTEGPITFTTTDLAGNTSTGATIGTGSIDLTTPVTPTFVTPTNFNPLTGSGEIGSIVTITDGSGSVVGTGIVDGSGSFSIISNPIPTISPITVTVTDPAGNTSTGANIPTGSIDVVDPVAPTVNTPTNFLPLTGTGEVGTTIKIFNTSNIVIGSGIVGSNGEFSITPSPIPNSGPINVTSTDEAGNESSVTTISTSSIDLTDPVVPVITLPTNFSPVTGTGEPGSEVTIYNASGAIIGTGTVSGSGTFSITPSPIPSDGPISITTTDPAGNTSTGSSIPTGSIDLIVPSVTSGTLTGSTTDTTATISWETSEATSSEIVYGLTTTLDETTGELDISPRVTSHSLTLNNLLSCTTYYYQTVSKDEAGNEIVDGIHNLSTTGCVGNATVEAESATLPIFTASGGTVETGTGETMIQLEIPVGYNDVSTCSAGGAYFQTKILSRAPIVTALGVPSGTPIFDAVQTYELSAYCNPNERLTSFDEPVTVTLSYSDADLGSFDEGSLKIHRYNTSTSLWEELNNCSVDQASNTITCETSNFSTFGIFGETESGSSSSGGGGGSRGGGFSSLTVSTIGTETSEEETSEEEESSEEETNEEETSVEEEITEEVSTPEEIVNIFPENTIEMTTEDGVEYTLSNNYDSCSTIGLLTDPEFVYATGSFSDIENSEYRDEILKFSEAGIVNGYDDGSFGTQTDISRTEFLKVVLKSHCLSYDDQDTSALEYIDVDTSSWQARVIARAQELGIINGDILEIDRELIDTNLGKGYSLERIEGLKNTFKMLGLYDGKVDGYYTDDFVSAVYNFQIQEGIVSNEYQPGAGSWGPATRQAFFVQYPQTSYRVFRSNDVISKSEAMKILMRMANIQATSPEELDYIDITTDWHIPYVRSGQTLGLFNPVKDDLEFNPNDGVTREDMVDLTYRLIQLYK